LKAIISTLIVVILVLSGFGAIATSQEQNMEINKIKQAFSKLDFKDEGKYITINIEQANGLLIKDGKPLLPMYTHQIVLPFGTKVKSVIVKPINIIEKTLPKQITPSPIAMTVGTETKAYNIKTSEISDPYPENWYDYDIRVGLKNNKRSLIIDIYFYPISYHPKNGTISWAKELDIDIVFEPAQESSFFKEEYDFIILTADEFYEELFPLIYHKTNRNVTTKIIKLSEIKNGTYFPANGSDDAEKVKYFIYQAADEEEGWGTKNVMLVGNKDKFPTRETHINVSSDDKNISDDIETFVSDLYFADLIMYNEDTQDYEFCDWDSNENNIYAEYQWEENRTDYMDLEPDVSIGRLAANDEEEVTTIVNKIVNYENSKAYTQNWFFNIVYCGGDSFIDEKYDEEGILEGEYVNEQIMKIMDGFIPKKMWVSNYILIKQSPTGVSKINETISEGCGFVDFSGHGNTNVWSTHPHLNDNIWVPTPLGQYNCNNMVDLTNGDKLPIVVTGACSVSKFSKDKTCFSWSFLSTNGGGSIANFGATGLGYAYLGTYVKEGLIEGMSIGTFTQYDEGALTIGEMWVGALNEYMKDHSINESYEYKTILEWELFGDPTLSIRDQSIPPEKPLKPYGPNTGKPEDTLTFNSSTTDIDDDEVYYLFDWGDGEFSEWIGPKNSGQEVNASHEWLSKGEFSIRVKAKDDHGILSEWSDPLTITITKTKNFQLILLNRLLEKIPLLKLFLNF
jgi:hypothetical protein